LLVLGGHRAGGPDWPRRPDRVHLGCPGPGPAATFQITAPNASAVVHATATMGNMTREAGVTVTAS